MKKCRNNRIFLVGAEWERPEAEEENGRRKKEGSFILAGSIFYM